MLLYGRHAGFLRYVCANIFSAYCRNSIAGLIFCLPEFSGSKSYSGLPSSEPKKAAVRRCCRRGVLWSLILVWHVVHVAPVSGYLSIGRKRTPPQEVSRQLSLRQWFPLIGSPCAALIRCTRIASHWQGKSAPKSIAVFISNVHHPAVSSGLRGKTASATKHVSAPAPAILCLPWLRRCPL